MSTSQLVDGVVIGLLLGFDGDAPLVVFAGNTEDGAVAARSLARLSAADTGREVALLFEDGDRSRPLIVGYIHKPARDPDGDTTVVRDGETLRISAETRLELRVGKAAIVLERDGRVTIRGSNVTTQASAANRLRGGSIHLN